MCKFARTHTHTREGGGGGHIGLSTPGETSENGAKKQIQLFLSDGVVLPREAETRAELAAQPQTECAQLRSKKNPYTVIPGRAKSQQRHSRLTYKIVRVY